MFGVSHFAQSSGQVVGTVFDPYEAVVPVATITFTKGKLKMRTTTNESGAYRVELPAGIYRVTVKRQGFLPYRRASFEVHPSESVVINIALAISHIPVGVLYIGPASKAPRFPPDPPLNYDLHQLVDSTKQRRELLIEYANRRKKAGLVEYTNGTASCDSFLIYADKLSFFRNGTRIEAIGNVIVEDGKQRYKTNRTVVSLRQGCRIDGKSLNL